jgi:hypothetical protein
MFTLYFHRSFHQRVTLHFFYSQTTLQLKLLDALPATVNLTSATLELSVALLPVPVTSPL